MDLFRSDVYPVASISHTIELIYEREPEKENGTTNEKRATHTERYRTRRKGI